MARFRIFWGQRAPVAPEEPPAEEETPAGGVVLGRYFRKPAPLEITGEGALFAEPAGGGGYGTVTGEGTAARKRRRAALAAALS
jgi:hypothetical protein